MLSKNEIKYIQSLGHKKSRDEEGVFIAEGPKLVQELLDSDFEVVKLYASPEWLHDTQLKGDSVTEVTRFELERISNLKTPNDVIIIVKQKSLNYEPATAKKIILVLDGIQDPGNMGTMIRIADWFGINQIVASENSVEIYNPKVVQATMGSICRVDIWYKNIEHWLRSVPVPVYGALLTGKSIYDIEKSDEGVLIIGNESKGISGELISLINEPVTIPKCGGAESLNAAVATGIILSHMKG